MKSIGVFGIGSPFGDDRIGWEAVDAARSAGFGLRYPLLRLETCDRPGTRLLALMSGLDSAFLIDAMQSGAPPGFIRRLDAENVGLMQGEVSTHGFGLSFALALGQALGALPRRLFLYGVEIVGTAPETSLAPEVFRSIPALLAHLSDDLDAEFSV